MSKDFYPSFLAQKTLPVRHINKNGFANFFVVVEFGDTWNSNFLIEYLRENEKIAKPFWLVHMAPRKSLFSKKGIQNLITLSL